MLRKFVLLGLVPAAFVLSGCQTTKMSAYEFDEYRVYVSASKENRQKAIASCIESIEKDHISGSTVTDRDVAVIMGVRPQDVHRTSCQRYIEGISSGRIRYEEYIS